MTSRINLGGTGSNMSLGINSNLKIQEILDKKTEELSKPINEIEDKISINNKKLDGYTEFVTLIHNMTSSLKEIRGVSDDQTKYNINAFNRKLVTIESVNSNNKPEYYIKPSIQGKVKNTSLNISTAKLATGSIIQSKAFSNSVTPLNLAPGIFMINGATISTDGTESLEDMANKINAMSSSSNVTAKVIQQRPGQYNIMLKSTRVGVDGTCTFADDDNIFSWIFDYDQITNPNPILQIASNAVVVIDGVYTIERDSNTITDLAEGVSITLLHPNKNDESININITSDIDFLVDECSRFVDSYNSLIIFMQEQCKKDSNFEYLESAKIRDDLTMSNIKTILSNNLITYMQDNEKYKTIFDIGFSFANKIIHDAIDPYATLLSFDRDSFTSAMLDKPQDVERILSFEAHSHDGKLQCTPYRGNILPKWLSNIRLVINNTQNLDAVFKYQDIFGNQASCPAQVQYVSNGVNSNAGISIRGVPLTPFNGFVLLYDGEVSSGDEIDINLAQGVGELIYLTMQGIISAEIIDRAKQNIADENYSYEAEKSRLGESIKSEHEKMINGFTQLEQHISQANSRLAFIEAMNRKYD